MINFNSWCETKNTVANGYATVALFMKKNFRVHLSKNYWRHLRHIGAMYALAGIHQCSKGLPWHHKSHKQALVAILKALASSFLAKCQTICVPFRTVALETLLEPKTVANDKGTQNNTYFSTFAPLSRHVYTSVRTVFHDIIKVTNKPWLSLERHSRAYFWQNIQSQESHCEQ